MSNIEKTNQSVSKTTTIKGLMSSETVKEKLHDLLGRNAAAFTTSVIQIASQNDMLAKADPTSILNAAMTATTLNLPLNNSIGHAYIVPFNEKQKDGSYKVKAQFILGAKGLRQLAIRSGQFQELYAKEVYEGQKIDDNSFVGYRFDWSKKVSDKIIGYASYFRLNNGFENLYYMSAEDVEKHGKKYSQTYKKGFGLWKTDFEKMAIKTIVKLHLNAGEAPLSTEMQKGISADQAIVNDLEGEDFSYPDNKEATIDIDQAARVKELNALEMNISEVSDIEHLESLQSDLSDDEEMCDIIQVRIEELKKNMFTDTTATKIDKK